MISVYISAILSMLIASAIVIEKRQIDATEIHISANVFSTDILAYRKALIDFKNANPAFTGSATQTQLTPYLLWGDNISTVGVGNFITADQLYVWNSGPFEPYQAEHLLKTMSYSLFVGYNRSGSLWTIKDNQTINTGISLPVEVPNDAIVIVGA